MPLAPGEVVMVLDVEQHLRRRAPARCARESARDSPPHSAPSAPSPPSTPGRPLSRDRATPDATAPAAARDGDPARGGCSAARPARRCRGCPSGSGARGTCPRGSPTASIDDRELAELDEVIAAAARAELRPRAILQLRGDRRDAPVARPSRRAGAAILNVGADAETRLALERAASAGPARRRAR